MPASDATRNTMLDAVLGSGLTVSLHSADPGLTGASEVAGGSYARKAISYAAAASGEKANSAVLEWTGMPACTVSHIAIWSGGSVIWSGPLTSARTIASGDTFRLAAGSVRHRAVNT